MSERQENTLTKEERNKLVEDNMGLITYAVNLVCKKPELWEDCYGEAQLGLVEAATYFNPDLGAKFSTFAVNEMKYRMYDYLYRSRNVRLPDDYRPRLVNFRNEIDSIQQQRFEEIEISSSTLLETAEAVGLNIDVLRVETAPPLSLDSPVYDDENNSCIGDTVGTNDLEEMFDERTLMSAVKYLREYAENVHSRNEQLNKWFKIHMNNCCDELMSRMHSKEEEVKPALSMKAIVAADFPEYAIHEDDSEEVKAEKRHLLDNRYCVFSAMWRDHLKKIRPALVSMSAITC